MRQVGSAAGEFLPHDWLVIHDCKPGLPAYENLMVGETSAVLGIEAYAAAAFGRQG